MLSKDTIVLIKANQSSELLRTIKMNLWMQNKFCRNTIKTQLIKPIEFRVYLEIN
jgi:hypothetical protein